MTESMKNTKTMILQNLPTKYVEAMKTIKTNKNKLISVIYDKF